MKQKVFLAVIAVLFTAGQCLSDDNLSERSYKNSDTLSLFVGEKTWQSTGDNEWNIAGTKSGGSPNVLSELEFLGLESAVYEIYGGLREGRGELAIARGIGSMHGGVYRDSDYLRDNRQGIFSLSTGAADGEEWNALRYWTIDYSYKLFMSKEEFNEKYLGMLIGYQEWHEKIRMTNGVQEFGGTLGPFSGLNSRYEFNWKSYRIGMEGGLPIYKWFSFKGKAVFIPYTEYKGEGIWNLRTDFRQSPSFEHKASGGYGAEAEASLGFHIYNSLTAELGYRYWYIKSGKGTDTTYFSDGSVGVTQFNEAISERQGLFLDVSYIFY